MPLSELKDMQKALPAGTLCQFACTFASDLHVCVCVRAREEARPGAR
jgi:hypothetical protein